MDAYHTEDEVEEKRRELKDIENHLKDENKADDDFYRMIKEAGGFDVYSDMLDTSDDAWIEYFHKKHNIGYRRIYPDGSSNETPSISSNSARISSRNITDCEERFPTIDRNKLHDVAGQKVYIDHAGRPLYARKNFGSIEEPQKGSRDKNCQDKVNKMGTLGMTQDILWLSNLVGTEAGRILRRKTTS